MYLPKGVNLERPFGENSPLPTHHHKINADQENICGTNDHSGTPIGSMHHTNPPRPSSQYARPAEALALWNQTPSVVSPNGHPRSPSEAYSPNNLIALDAQASCWASGASGRCVCHADRQTNGEGAVADAALCCAGGEPGGVVGSQAGGGSASEDNNSRKKKRKQT